MIAGFARQLPVRPRFPLGQVVATPGALEAVSNQATALDLLKRHVTLEQGDLCADDYQRNLDALVDGSRIFSAFTVGNTKIWIITEADRSSTCILLPSEY